MHLFSNGSLMLSKGGKNKKGAQLSVSLMLVPHFDIFCDPLLYRPTTTWNLFVFYSKKAKCCSW